jgi:ferredoxin
MAVKVLLPFDVAGARRGGHAGLDEDARLGLGDLAGAQVADGATPLLDIGEEAGVLMPSGCRMGICFGCVTPLKAGAVRDLRTGEITEAEPGVLIQTCVSAAAGPCDIER